MIGARHEVYTCGGDAAQEMGSLSRSSAATVFLAGNASLQGNITIPTSMFPFDHHSTTRSHGTRPLRHCNWRRHFGTVAVEQLPMVQCDTFDKSTTSTSFTNISNEIPSHDTSLQGRSLKTRWRDAAPATSYIFDFAKMFPTSTANL
jgi:hypothetical protein